MKRDQQRARTELAKAKSALDVIHVYLSGPESFFLPLSPQEKRLVTLKFKLLERAVIRAGRAHRGY